MYNSIKCKVYTVECTVYNSIKSKVYTIKCTVYDSVLWRHEEAVTGQCKGDMDRATVDIVVS